VDEHPFKKPSAPPKKPKQAGNQAKRPAAKKTVEKQVQAEIRQEEQQNLEDLRRCQEVRQENSKAVQFAEPLEAPPRSRPQRKAVTETKAAPVATIVTPAQLDPIEEEGETAVGAGNNNGSPEAIGVQEVNVAAKHSEPQQDTDSNATHLAIVAAKALVVASEGPSAPAPTRVIRGQIQPKATEAPSQTRTKKPAKKKAKPTAPKPTTDGFRNHGQRIADLQGFRDEGEEDGGDAEN
jgi:hypothetical protein